MKVKTSDRKDKEMDWRNAKMKVKVLIVDDNKANISMLTDIFDSEGYIVHSVDNSLLVLDSVQRIKPDIIILDIMMPEMDGFEVCRQLKWDFDMVDIPVIMITAKSDANDIKRALELGAFDYIKKPVDEIEVIARVQSALRFKRHQDMLHEMAMKDGLTGAYNHALLLELFEKELAKCERTSNSISFVMIDIDYFKVINDTFGHTIGNEVLKELTNILKSSVRKSDIVGRYGGEEFGMVLTDISREETIEICERIRAKVQKNVFQRDVNIKVKITISIGICTKGCYEIIEAADIVKRADEALYKAKRNGRNRVEICAG